MQVEKLNPSGMASIFNLTEKNTLKSVLGFNW